MMNIYQNYVWVVSPKKGDAVRIFILCITICWAVLTCLVSSASAAEALSGKKIVLIPLDSRPVNTTYITLLGEMSGMSIVYPEEGLDRYDRPADYPKLKRFLEEQIPTTDAVFICIPQWLNGSLIASRHTETYIQNARRMEELKTLLSKHRAKNIYLVGLIPREKPSYSGGAFTFATELTQYGRKYTQYMLAETQTGRNYMLYFLRQIERTIPAFYLQDYVKLFDENAKVLYSLADWAKEGIVDEVIIGIDDTSDMGLPKLNEKRVKNYCQKHNIPNVHILSGADDITALVLARYKNEQTNVSSHYSITFSHNNLKAQVKAYDGQPLEDIIAQKIAFVQPKGKTSHAVPVSLYIHSHEEPIENIKRWIHEHPQTLRGVADVSYASFLDTIWMENYLRDQVSRHIDSYAAWNTSGNTIGLLLSHLEMIKDEPTWNEAHERWLTLRYAEDYYYNIIKRYEYALRYSSIAKLPPEEEAKLMQDVRTRTNVLLNELSIATRKNGQRVSLPTAFRVQNASLPWGRIFEIQYVLQ
jgi:hypothetical protein